MDGQRISGFVIALGAILIFWWLEKMKFFHLGGDLNLSADNSAPDTGAGASDTGFGGSWPCVLPSLKPSAHPAAAGQSFALGAPLATTQGQSTLAPVNNLPVYAKPSGPPPAAPFHGPAGAGGGVISVPFRPLMPLPTGPEKPPVRVVGVPIKPPAPTSIVRKPNAPQPRAQWFMVAR